MSHVSALHRSLRAIFVLAIGLVLVLGMSLGSAALADGFEDPEGTEEPPEEEGEQQPDQAGDEEGGEEDGAGILGEEEDAPEEESEEQPDQAGDEEGGDEDGAGVLGEEDAPEDEAEGDGTEEDGSLGETDGAEGEPQGDGSEQDDTEVLGESMEADDEAGTTPTGGVDAGFGGTAADAGGFGVPHAVAIGLLGLALAGHAALGRAESAA